MPLLKAEFSYPNGKRTTAEGATFIHGLKAGPYGVPDTKQTPSRFMVYKDNENVKS